MRHGFSLVELSIVLVILGLLTGGILAGQSLIRAAELRAVVSEYQRYTAATQTFRDKYMALPGDMANATAFWGKDNAACSSHTGTATTPGTCNGNGNGLVEGPLSASTTGEFFQFWKHMALAGLIEGTYTGVAGPGGSWDTIVGTNAPTSRATNSGWNAASLWGGGLFPGDGASFSYRYGNLFAYGTRTVGTWSASKILKPEEAWNIDTKLDDGKPGTGRILGIHWSTCTTATSNTDNANANYALSTTSIECALYFSQAF